MAKQERHRNDISYDGNYYIHVHNDIMIHTLWTVNDFTVKESLERFFSASVGSFQVKDVLNSCKDPSVTKFGLLRTFSDI